MALLLRQTKKAIGGCRRFSSLSEGFTASTKTNGWEFKHVNRSFEEAERQKFASEMNNLPLPRRFKDEDLSITHLFSGIKITFNPLDGLEKYREESETGNPLQSHDFPSYTSPFQPTHGSFDSAYTGMIYLTTNPKRVYPERGGEESCTIKPKSYILNPNWEYVDWNTACDRVDWLSRKDHWPRSKPSTEHLGHYKSSEREPIYLKRNLYSDCSTGQSAYYYLVVTDEGWWVRLVQTYPSYDLTKRVMDMHFKFMDNVIYREIIEYKRDDARVDEEMGDKLLVHFHEVKQLNMIEGCMGISVANKNANKYQSFTTNEWLTSYDTSLTLSKNEVRMLFADSGQRIQSFEQDTKTRLQLFPLFEVTQPKRIYLCGAKEDVEAAKSVLANDVLGRNKRRSESDQTIDHLN